MVNYFIKRDDVENARHYALKVYIMNLRLNNLQNV